MEAEKSRSRKLVEFMIAEHFDGRPGLGVKNPRAVAEKLIARRSESWVNFFLAVTDSENKFASRTELAAKCGVGAREAKEFYASLRGMYVTTASGEHRVFRDGWELRNRNNGKHADGTRYRGGALLHLASSKKLDMSMLRTITDSTETATESIASNYRQAANDQAEECGSIEQRAEIERKRDEVITGTKDNVLPLFAGKSA